jgi:hypothetical protein
MVMRAIALALALAAIPAAAGAQDARQAAAQARIDAQAFQDRLGQELRTNALEEQMDASRATQNPRRVRRAEEAAAMINNGDCPGARGLATRANDARLLARIEQVCSALESPTTASSAPVQ